eukprot:8011753-Pyramimonas_sp.AAC.1
MAASHRSASVSLERYAGELFEEIFVGDEEINWRTGRACPSRGNLRRSSSSRTPARPPRWAATWRGRPRIPKPLFLRDAPSE